MAGMTAWFRRPEHRLRPGAPRSRMLLAGLAIFAVLFLTGSLLYAQFGRDTAQVQTQQAQDKTQQAEGQRNATAAQASDLAVKVIAVCRAGGAAAEPLLAVGACPLAAQVQASPAVTTVVGQPGPGPTQAQIAAAVAEYLIAHPPPAGRAPTVGEITAAVAEFLTANPPQPGRPPTAAEIASAVSAYLVANPPAQGPKGDQGPGPTQAEIASAVADYMQSHPAPPCPSGTHSESYTYPDDVAGARCVDDTQPTTAPMPPP